MRYGKKTAGVAITFLIMAIAAYWILGWQENTTIRIRRDASEKVLDQARRLSGIGALGRVEPRSRVVAVSYDAAGDGARIDKILVEEGQAVRRGDVIAVFSDIDQRQAKYASALAKVQLIAAKIQAEQSTESYYKSEYKRMNELWKAGAISQSRFDEAGRNLRQSQATVVALNAEFASVSADSDFSQIELSRASF